MANPCVDAAPSSSSVSWSEIVQRIKDGDSTAVEELYGILGKGVLFFLRRQVGEHAEDKFHDVFLIVVNAIQNGHVREPERLPGFVRTVVRRAVVAYIDRAVKDRSSSEDAGATLADGRPTPDKQLCQDEQVELMKLMLRRMPERDREILRRFYLLEQPPTQICREMGLTETQFRLFKSRAKERLQAQVQRKIAGKFMRLRSSAARISAAS